MTAGARCWHCGEPLPAGDTIHATVAGSVQAVCCVGCRAAAEWIDHLGLADYYRLRDAPAPRASGPDGGASAWSRPELQRHVVRELDGGRREALLLVEGLRCPACAWLIERALGAVHGVASVQVNVAARRARVTWNASGCDLPAVLLAFARTGYSALPLDAAALDDARRRESRAALKRLLVAGLGAMQAMMYASAGYFGVLDDSTRDLMRWFGLIVVAPVVVYAGQPFYAGAIRALRARRLSMDVPVAIAIALIFIASVSATFGGGGEVYFDSVGMFVFLLLLGRFLEMRARHRASDLTDALARLTPAFADRVRADGGIERVGAAELAPGDRLHLAEGSRVPADGALESASCGVDEALLSGESALVHKRRGDPLAAGSVVVEGPARMRVERVGAETAVAGIVALVTRAQAERPRLANAGELAAAGFVARVLVIAACCAIGWLLIDPARAFDATVAVLVVSCPCALALAVPTALTRALGVLARRGVLVVHPDAMEGLAGATHVVFDKTGTLTDARLELERVEPRAGVTSEEARAYAAALARGSRHPVARALADEVDSSSAHDVEGLRAEAGGGLEARIGGRLLRLGHARFALGEPGAGRADDAVVLADEQGELARFLFSERLRPDARATVRALGADGLAVEIVSGDSAPRVEAVAASLSLPAWRARQRPADKLARLAELRRDGARVIAVGDGVNDAPVLAGADVAVALAGGADLAQAASDIVLAGGRLGALAEARSIARETMAILRQNHRWSVAYNLVAVSFAALGFVPPWLAAIGMSASSLFVVLNATRIGREERPTESESAVACELPT